MRDGRSSPRTVDGYLGIGLVTMVRHLENGERRTYHSLGPNEATFRKSLPTTASMNYCAFTTALVAALFVVAAGADQDPFYDILEAWPGHFKANFCLTAPQDLYGWKIRIAFDGPVSGGIQVPNVRLLGKNLISTIYRISDSGANGRWLTGERNCFHLTGMHQGLQGGRNAEVSFTALPEVKECDNQTPGQEFSLEITDHWEKGIKGNICLRVPRNFSGDWKIRMELDKEMRVEVPITIVGTVKTHLIYALGPRDFNRDLTEDERFCFEFLGQTSKWLNPCIKAFFTEEDGITPILPPTAAPNCQNFTLNLKHAWSQGYDAVVCFYPPGPITCGWETELRFEPAVDSIQTWRATVKGEIPDGAGNVYTLVNKNWNKAIAESSLCFSFLASKSFSGSPVVNGAFTRTCANGVYSTYERCDGSQ